MKFTKGYWKPIKPPNKEYRIEGWDTETYPPEHKWRGRTFLLTHYDGVYPAKYRIESADDMAEALVRTGNQSIHFFYNLRFDAEGMLKWFGEAKMFQVLAETEKPVEIHPGLFAKYVTDKCLILGPKTKLGYLNNPMKIFDIAQFYDRRRLKDVAPIVGMKKVDEDSLVDIDRYDTDEEYRNNYDQYAIVDAIICQKLAERFYQVVNKIIPCSTFFSTASIGKHFILGQGIDNNLKLADRVLQWALLATSGARIETIKRGTFTAWKVDKISAYPSFIVDLPSVKGMEFRKYNPHVGPNPDAHYGFYCVNTKTYDEKFGLLPNKREMPICYPIGNRKFEYITKPELDTLLWRGFKVEVLGGMEGFHDDPQYPFRCVRDKVFDPRNVLKKKKQALEDAGLKESDEYLEYDLMQLVLKIIMNSIYGCFLQLTPNTVVKHWSDMIDVEDIIDMGIFDENGSELVKVYADTKFKAGIMFNPVYASYILAQTRSELYRLIYENNLEDNVIFFATDAIATDCKPIIPFGKNLGEWEMDLVKKPLTVIGSGVYYYEKEGKDGKIEKVSMTRGLKKMNHDPLTCDFCLEGSPCDYFYFENIREVKQKFVTRPKPVHAASAIRQGRFDDLNVFERQQKTVDLNFDKKRNWLGQFESAEEIWTKQIDSLPLVIP